MRSIACTGVVVFWRILLATTLAIVPIVWLGCVTAAGAVVEGPPVDSKKDAASVAASSSSSSGACLVDVHGRCDTSITTTSTDRRDAENDPATTTATCEKDNKIIVPDLPRVWNNMVEIGYGEPQQVQGDEAEKTYQHIVEMHRYMYEDVYPDPQRPICFCQHSLCAYWATIGECETNEDFMKSQCAPACHSCDTRLAQHESQYTGVGSDALELLDTGYGVPQQVIEPHTDATRQLIRIMDQYMHEVVYADNYPYPEIRTECQNQHELCALWATMGECTTNAGYMHVKCAPACLSCEYVSFQHRCPLPDNLDMLTQQNIWKPGDLNAMFERIVSTSDYNSTILLSPNNTTSRRPWVVVVDDFLSPLECSRLIALGGQRGYEISTEEGAKLADGTHDAVVIEGRTSTTAWCLAECYTDPITQQVIRKIEELTGIPDANSEYLQLLRYEENQFYRIHHDYGEQYTRRAYGARILTLFLYLNDVPTGGETRFPKLNLTVVPKQGRALLWPNVLNDEPDVMDPSTEHEALPVLEGIKYGANAWLHQRDFKTPFERNCI